MTDDGDETPGDGPDDAVSDGSVGDDTGEASRRASEETREEPPEDSAPESDELDGQHASDEGTEQSGEDSDQPNGSVEAEGGSTGTEGGSATAQSADSVETTVTKERNQSDDSMLAALVSFIIPGLGNMLTGQTERGMIIFILWVIWLMVGWGVGVFLIGTFITVITLGLGIIIWIVLGLVVGFIELAIHVVAAMDAYQQSELVDNVTVRVNEIREN